jgi:glycosyltransferase involved in cell wall biosynthesis
MKICMFTNTYLPHVGGVARSVALFVEDLYRMGHRVLVVAPTFSGDTDADQEGIDVLRVPAIQNFNGSDFSVRIPLPFILNERVDAFKPEVIHSHHPYLLGDAALRVARQRDLPLVFTHHTLYEKYTHYVPLDSKAMQRFAIYLSTTYGNLATAVVAPSRSLVRLLRRRGVERPIVEIPTGVDTRFFRTGRRREFREAYGISENGLVVGHLGRLAPEKNLEYLAQAVSRFMEGHPETHFLVAGGGPSQEPIRSIFRERGLERQVIFTGAVRGERLRDVYHAMDLFVFASKTETQGMVLVEAMAAGKPVIGLDAPGVREVVEDGRNGRLLPGNTSPDAFARVIEEVARDSQMPRRWRRDALETAKRFSREVCAQKMARLYDSLETPSRREPEDLVPWDALLRAIQVEWDLVLQKTGAIVHAIRAEEGKEELD